MVESTSWINWFYNGGIFAWWVLAAGVFAFHTAVVALILAFFAWRSQRVGRACRIVAYVALGLSLLTIAVGWVGQQYGISITQAAVAHVEPSMKEEILRIGREESAIPLKRSLFMALPMLVMTGIAFAVASRKK
jgi:hypothetical protein